MRPAEKSYRLPEPLPDGLRAIGVEESGRAWLAVLPRLVAEVVERWQLEVGEPFLDASASFTLRAADRDERPLVLKLQYPHREAEQEAAALRAWGGALACAGVVMTLDQITKQAAVAIVEPGHPREIIFGVDLTNVRTVGCTESDFSFDDDGHPDVSCGMRVRRALDRAAGLRPAMTSG